MGTSKVKDDVYVVFDIDGVLADFSHSFSRLAQTMYIVATMQTDQQKNFRWLREQGVSKAEQDLIWNKVERSQTFWSGMPCLLSDFDRRAMWMLAEEGVRFLYVTNRQDKGTMVDQTHLWLRENNLPPGELVLTKNKADYIRQRLETGPWFNLLGVIEDSPYNLPDYEKLDARDGTGRSLVYVQDWAYNRDIATTLPRVGSVLEFCDTLLDVLQDIRGEKD